MKAASPECRLLAGFFADCVQFGLGVGSLSVVLIKWRLEKPRRRFQVWIWDVSKQATGALFAHFLNMGLAMVLSVEEKQKTDVCALYFLGYLVDTLCCPFGWLLLRLLEKLSKRVGWKRLEESGNYCTFGPKPSVKTWLLQLSTWMFIILFLKVILALLTFAAFKPLNAATNFCFGPLQPYPNLELMVVMTGAPLGLNAIQFILYDNILKAVIKATRKNQTPDYGSVPSSPLSDVTESDAPYSLLDDQERKKSVHFDVD